MKKSQLKAADDTAVHCVIHNDREKDMPMKQRDMIHQWWPFIHVFIHVYPDSKIQWISWEHHQPTFWSWQMERELSESKAREVPWLLCGFGVQPPQRSEDGVSNIVFLFAFLQTSFIVERRGKQLLSGIGGIGGIATVNLVSISYQISRLSIHVWSFFLFVETLPSGKHTKNYGKSP